MTRPEGGRSALVLWSSLLVAVTADVLLGGPLTRVDHLTAPWLERTVDGGERHNPFLVLLTQFGSPLALLFVTPIVATLSVRHRSVRPLARLAVVVVLLVVVVYAAKVGFGRMPPTYDGLWTRDGRSFPSGHTATATVLWGVVAWVVADLGESEAARRATRGWRWLAPLLTGTAMTLTTYHWTADVLAGAAAGVLVLAGARVLDEWQLGHWPGASRGTGAGGSARRDVGVPAGLRGDRRPVHDPRRADT